jgi:hypothetical protein
MQERVKIDMVENLSLSLYMEFARLAYDKNFVRLQHNQSYDQCIHIQPQRRQFNQLIAVFIFKHLQLKSTHVFYLGHM